MIEQDIVGYLLSNYRKVSQLAVQCEREKLPYLPFAQQLNQEVAAIALVEELGDEVEVGDKRALQDDGHVGGVEQLDGVVLLRATPLL